MIDDIVDIEDFKKIIERKKLDVNDLRKCLLVTSVDKHGVFFKHEVILTIPVLTRLTKDYIMRCVVAKETFSSFAKDKDTTENKQYTEWLKNATKKVDEHFGESIVTGNWIEQID